METIPFCIHKPVKDGEEQSLEELRAQRYFKQQDRETKERLRRLSEEEQKLRQELEEKKRLLLLLMKSQELQVSEAPPAAASSFHVYDESQAAAERPAGNSDELPEDVFLPPEERGLSLMVQVPHRAGAVVPSKCSQRENTDSDPANESCTGQQDVQAESGPKDTLSPIQEVSLEAGSCGSGWGPCSDGSQGDPMVDPDTELIQSVTPSPRSSHRLPEGGAADPCDPETRRRLLERCDLTSSPDLHSEPRPLPAVEENSLLTLGGSVFYVSSRCLDAGSFSIFKGATKDKNVILKVERGSAPWDFCQFVQLREKWACPASPPHVSGFQFTDGCVTVYAAPQGHMLTEVSELAPIRESVVPQAAALLQLVERLQSCGLLHGALQPAVLACCRQNQNPPSSGAEVFPVDWSSSVDLELQRDVCSVQQLPSAQSYVSAGLLEPTDPPHLVDLMGVAETVHQLLTNEKMVPVRDAGGWTVERFSGGNLRDADSELWSRFFCSLLNPRGRSPPCVLSELQELLLSTRGPQSAELVSSLT